MYTYICIYIYIYIVHIYIYIEIYMYTYIYMYDPVRKPATREAAEQQQGLASRGNDKEQTKR